jgi:hypothetical protein
MKLSIPYRSSLYSPGAANKRLEIGMSKEKIHGLEAVL